jgi:hypothetical protein
MESRLKMWKVERITELPTVRMLLEASVFETKMVSSNIFKVYYFCHKIIKCKGQLSFLHIYINLKEKLRTVLIFSF